VGASVRSNPVAGGNVRVVVGALLTPEGAASVAHGVEAVERSSGVLHLVRYVPNPTGGESEADEYGRDRASAEAELERQVQELRSRGITCEGHLSVGQSRPAASILEVAGEVGADLIVIGVRRRSRVGKLVLGSNAMDILMGAACPVLAVKAAADTE
jgi:nucleotide-binding universal stress UspA family protein